MWLMAAAIMLLASPAWGGGSGLNVVVVVNQNSTNSVQLGNSYCELRGVPPENVMRMTGWTGSTQTWSLAEFETRLRNPLREFVRNRGLTNQAQYVLLSMDIPYRVKLGESENSTTAVLFYGFKTNTTPSQAGLPNTCSLPSAASNSYAFSELPWPDAAPASPPESFLAMMLTARTLAQAQTTAALGVAADGSFPSSPVYLAKTSDSARNVRYFDFDNAIFESEIRGDSSLIRTNTDSTSFNGLGGLCTGLAAFTLPAGAFLPGAIADSLTSWSGALFQNDAGTILSFIEGGATATYGTVVEPCNIPSKFPNPMVYFYQHRGFSAAESYYLAVGAPFQGIMLGEPLSAPFARYGTPGKTTITNAIPLTNTVTISGKMPFTFTFYSPDLKTPLSAADLFLDGLYFTNLARVDPEPGNRFDVQIGATPITYTVPAGATLSNVTVGLAGAINAQKSVTGIQAYSLGDRIQLRSTSALLSGSSPQLTASVSMGSAAKLTSFIQAAQAKFVESPATGYFGMAASNSPAVDEWLALEFIKTNGVKVVVGVTNDAAGTFMSDFVRLLIEKVNATPELQSADGVRADDLYPYGEDRAAYFAAYARSPGWDAAQIQIALTGSPGLLILAYGTRLIDNEPDLLPRNHLYLGSGAVLFPATIELDTTQLADGWHELTAVAYEGTSVRTQTRTTHQIRVQNTGLTATFAPLTGTTNAGLGAPLSFSVTANQTDISRIELFSTGGSVAAVTNQSQAILSVSTTALGLGLHPFYAIITRADGKQYRTETIRIRIVAAPNLEITGPPWRLTWTAIPGHAYNILASTNLTSFQKVATVTPTSTAAEWIAPSSTANAVFYRIEVR
jgi:uncharacterized protein (TIGR03790 family)